MITREEFDETVAEFTEKMGYIADQLENLWQYINSSKSEEPSRQVREKLEYIATRIESLQFSDFANPEQFRNKMRFHKFYDVLKENEKADNLDRFIEYERFANNIVKMAKKFEEKSK